MKRTSIITLVIMAVILALGAGYILLLDESEKQKRQQTPAAKALLIDDANQAYTNVNGESVDLADNFGNIMVVSSWASWCPQCKDDLGRLDQVANEFKDRDVRFLAVNRAEDKYSAERFLNTFTQPQHIEIILDPSDHFFAANAGYAMPETIVYDKDGNIITHMRGDLRTDELKQVLEEALR